MQVAVKPDRPCGPQRAIALLAEADHLPTRAKNTGSPDHDDVPSVGEPTADRGPGHGGGKAIVNKERQMARAKATIKPATAPVPQCR